MCVCAAHTGVCAAHTGVCAAQTGACAAHTERFGVKTKAFGTKIGGNRRQRLGEKCFRGKAWTPDLKTKQNRRNPDCHLRGMVGWLALLPSIVWDGWGCCGRMVLQFSGVAFSRFLCNEPSIRIQSNVKYGCLVYTSMQYALQPLFCLVVQERQNLLFYVHGVHHVLHG